MAQQFSLDSFGGIPKKKQQPPQQVETIIPAEEQTQQPTNQQPKQEPVAKEPVIYPDFPENLPPSYLVSVDYNGKKALATLKLYEPLSQRIYFWDDNTGHKSYCLTSIAPSEVEKLSRITGHSSYAGVASVEKYNALIDKTVTVTKVMAKDPLAIGGRQFGCFRDIIPRDYQELTGVSEPPKVWEAFIRYYQSYIYDKDLAIGMLYKIENGNLIRVQQKSSEQTIQQILALFPDVGTEFLQSVEMWARLLESPAPEFKRVGLDIEVSSAVATRVPDPEEANDPVVCVALGGSDHKKQ
ncbi:MAG: hypothetical protein WC325_06615, partial [Candidatus Bathyarchaeia archaeon]